jgi:hypothetical protein
VNTLRQHLPPLWTQRLDDAHQSVANARAAILRTWYDAPPWVRSRAALGGAVALVAIALLASLAMVVQGVVERSADLPGVDRVGAALAHA